MAIPPRLKQSICLLGLLTAAGLGYGLFRWTPAPESHPLPSLKAADHGALHKTRAQSDLALTQVPRSDRQTQLTSSTERGLDSEKTGWRSETISEAIGRQLKVLAHVIETRGQPSDLASVVADPFRSTALRPKRLQTVYSDSAVTVRRQIPTDDWRNRSVRPAHGESIFAPFAEVASPTTASPSAGDFHIKFKIVRIGLEAIDATGLATSDVYVEAYVTNRDERPTSQWTSTWHCEWHVRQNQSPRLASLVVGPYEEVDFHAINGVWMRDATDDVFGDDVGQRDQLNFGMDYWLRHLEGRVHVSRLGHNGIAIGDVNGDTRPDIYICQSGGLPNRLYVQQADGTVRETSPEAGVNFLDDTTCALLVDLDNDGDQDLAVATISGGVLLANDGHGHFEQRAYLRECQNAFSLTSADYNQDGLLDLYVGRYWPTSEGRGEIPIPVPYFDGQNGGSNVLFKNDGQWSFTDVTGKVGLDADNSRYTMAAAWNDLDDDGDQDLYVANDFGRNCLYDNREGHFVNIADSARVEDVASGMSVTFSDFDHDGRSDIYISNMFSSAGNRIAYQRQYVDRFDADGVQSLRRMARGNSLFRNLGNGTFQDVSISSATTMGRWSWGSLFADINNDGWDDLLVANGNITAEKSTDL